MPPIRHDKKAAKRAQREAQAVSLRDLKWKPVEIPAMALASGSRGSRRGAAAPAADGVEEEEQGDEWDPFANLDEAGGDFMGLQEVKGVGVKYQETESGAKRVEFYQLDGDNEQDSQEEVKARLPAKADRKQKKAKATAATVPVDVSFEASQSTSTASKGKKRKLDEAEASTSSKDNEKEAEKKATQAAKAAKPSAAAKSDHDDADSLAIPSGLFASFTSNLDSAQDGSPSSTLSSIRFEDRKLSSWPKPVLSILHPALKRAVLGLGFTKPTPVQAKTLPLSLLPLSAPTSEEERPRDLIALAQTGSGKTLAYALPILQRVLASRSSFYDSASRPLQALIILPTRELALQVYEVFQKLVDASVGEGGKKWVRIAPIVGGMSEERQWRLLRGRKNRRNDEDGAADEEGEEGSHDAEIVIGTVGRLWELCKSDDYLPTRIRDAGTLVLDEADRLLETGKFQELSSLLELLDPDNDERQTLLFSATLDATLQVNLAKSRAKVARMVKQSKKGGKDALMVKLVEQVGFRDQRGPELVDLTVEAKTSESLKEGKIDCLDNEKDLYLYYLLLRYPGSYLVFLNSIDSVRRLQPLLTNLSVQSFPLHGEMDQRSRLRSLDGFKKTISPGASKTSVLLATDVAARGLDVPLVSHVVHFHLPRSADSYIHRSGRTARAGQSGLSLVLLAPSEKSRWMSLRKQLAPTPGGSPKEELKDLPILHSVLGRLKTRIRLAKELDEARHRSRKEKAEDDWMKKMAEEAEIALDDDDDIDPDAPQARKAAGGGGKKGKGKSKEDAAATRRLEVELADELSQDVVVRGVRRKFLTGGAAGVGSGADGASSMLRDLVEGTGHATFVGLGRSTAEQDLEAGLGKKKGKKSESA